nr:kinesin-like protein kin-4c [Quercus suber]
MENLEVRSSQCIRVVISIRPLITSELGCTDCISVLHGEPLPQVQIGSHSFTFDYVYGSTGLPCFALYDDCVSPLVDALFHGNTYLHLAIFLLSPSTRHIRLPFLLENSVIAIKGSAVTGPFARLSPSGQFSLPSNLLRQLSIV